MRHHATSHEKTPKCRCEILLERVVWNPEIIWSLAILVIVQCSIISKSPSLQLISYHLHANTFKNCTNTICLWVLDVSIKSSSCASGSCDRQQQRVGTINHRQPPPASFWPCCFDMFGKFDRCSILTTLGLTLETVKAHIINSFIPVKKGRWTQTEWLHSIWKSHVRNKRNRKHIRSSHLHEKATTSSESSLRFPKATRRPNKLFSPQGGWRWFQGSVVDSCHSCFFFKRGAQRFLS